MVDQKAFHLNEASCAGNLQISPSPALKLTTWEDFPLLVDTPRSSNDRGVSCNFDMSSSSSQPVERYPQHFSTQVEPSSSSPCLRMKTQTPSLTSSSQSKMQSISSASCLRKNAQYSFTNHGTRHSKKSISKKSVSFSSLEIRSYEVTLGDHPSSFPLSLSWEHFSASTLNIDAYEKLKQGLRRHGNELRLTIYERMCALNLLELEPCGTTKQKHSYIEGLIPPSKTSLHRVGKGLHLTLDLQSH